MLGMFHLLPLLKGWEYKIHQIERRVRRGETVSLAISERGWLLSIVCLTDDCYGRIRIQWQGADLETKELVATSEDGRFLGAFAQDPSGWVQRYFRPNPFSTAGLYIFALYSGWAQGSVLPYVPAVKLEVSLAEQSTQESAYILVVAFVVAITDVKAFICSLRRVLDAKASLKIDPALFVVGPVEFKEEKE